MSSESLESLWRDRLQQWQESSLTQTAWCQQNNLNSHQLSYWKRKFRDQSSRGKLVPLSVPPETSRLTTVTVTLPSGIHLKVQTDNIIDLVRELARL